MKLSIRFSVETFGQENAFGLKVNRSPVTGTASLAPANRGSTTSSRELVSPARTLGSSAQLGKTESGLPKVLVNLNLPNSPF